MKFKFSTAVAIAIVGATTTATFSDAAALADVDATTPALNNDNDKQQKKQVCKSNLKKCEKAIKEEDDNKYKFCGQFIDLECSDIKKVPTIPID